MVRLDRPEALNALSPELMEELAATLERIERDGEARAIVIMGDDRAFAAGADLKAMRQRSFQTTVRQANRFWGRVAAIELPLIAAVSGYAFGGGCELALSCDLVVASESAVFCQPEILIGIIPGGGGTQRLARTIGRQRAMEMVLTGRRVGAAEAREMGLVNMVAGKDEWRQAALELAARVAAMPPLAVMFAKRAVLAAEEAPLAAGLSFERRLYELTMATEDRDEGISAFIERREPEWSGR